MKSFMFSPCIYLFLTSSVTVYGHGSSYTNSTNLTSALNAYPQNTEPTNGGPDLYYNGTGPVPGYETTSPIPVPITPYNNANDIANSFYNELVAIYSNSSYLKSNNCTQCIVAQELMHFAAITLPVEQFTNLLIKYCTLDDFSIYAVSCHAQFASTPLNASTYSSDAAGVGPYWAQLYAKMSGQDFQAWCNFQFEVCPALPVVQIDEKAYFSPKPASANIAPPPSGKTIDVLHLSDWHIDPRYDIGSEANCSQYLCCRPYSTNTKLHTNVNNASVPASRYGYFFCDSPADLALSSFDTMGQFFNKGDVAFTIFTGDIVSHDNDDQLSRAYVEYSEMVTYQTFKAQMGNSPIYATLGNHDSLPEAFNTPNNINNNGANAFSWNYELLSGLWQQYGWLNNSEANYASTHYAAYAHTTAQGLRIISINTDFWYRDNIFNYYNTSNPDNSGVLKFLADELTACEARGQRAWIIGHVLSGYDGTQQLVNPSALFYSIVRRFSPATIAAVFFGHTHEGQLQIFYDYLPSSMNNATGLRNTTAVDYSKPLQMGFIGPSITPLTGYNAGYQLLQVDSETFSVMGVQTYIANMSESLAWTSPVWQYEYDARKTYNVGSVGWPISSPLNATFYDRVTKQMQADPSLVSTYNFLQTKSSIMTKNCTSASCQRQTICHIKSGSSALGQLCASA